MSGDNNGKDPPKPRHLHSVSGNGAGPSSPAVIKRLPPEQEKILFMKSNHIEWTPFAKSLGLNPRVEKPLDEFKEWSYEKRMIIAREQSEEVGESLFKHRARWHADVLKTLTEYPETADAMMAILKKRANDIVKTINDDNKKMVQAAQSGEAFVSEFSKIKTSELTSLAAGMKLTTEFKHKSLMLDNWSLKDAEMFTDPKQFETQKAEDHGWKLEIVGQNGPIDGLQLRDMMTQYYDNKPAKAEGEIIDVEPPLETT